MSADLLSAFLRGLGFIALLQAGGVAIFLSIFGTSLRASRPPILRIGWVAVCSGLVLLLAQYLLEPVRMAGEWAGVFDWEMQRFLIGTPAFGILALRLLAIFLVAVGLSVASRRGSIAGVAGATIAAATFALTGHTAISPERWLLAPLLVVHLLVVQFWFGALLPLERVCRLEIHERVARVAQRLSAIATVLVPLVLFAGAVIAMRLLPAANFLQSDYGKGIIVKATAFLALMAIAAINKLRLVPAITRGSSVAVGQFRSSVRLEFALIAATLVFTAFLTTFRSP